MPLQTRPEKSDINKVWWNRDNYAKQLPHLVKRQKMVKMVRDYFDNEGFFEVETPALEVSPGMEVHLKAFATELEEPFTGDMKKLYLHTSPEFCMKKLLVAGLPKIYQLAKVFRNGERSTHHHPEFCMIEWYRAGDDYYKLMEDCVYLLQKSAEFSEDRLLKYEGVTCDPFKEWERFTIEELFIKYVGFGVLDTIDNPYSHNPSPEELRKRAHSIGIKTDASDTWEDIFFRIMLNKVEPHLGFNGVPTIIYEYPLCLAALSRQSPKDERVAERFELYVCGLELANAFSELTNAEVQLKRFEDEQEAKQKIYGYTFPIDYELIDALEYGMPECTGIALGIDRLAMVTAGVDNIESVLWAPVQAP